MSNEKIVLKLENINKDYRQGRSTIEVLKNINLEVIESQLIAIVGVSGSGKSTLLHIAGLLDKADSGEIYIEGVDERKVKNLKYAPHRTKRKL